MTDFNKTVLTDDDGKKLSYADGEPIRYEHFINDPDPDTILNGPTSISVGFDLNNGETVDPNLIKKFDFVKGSDGVWVQQRSIEQ